MGHFLVLIFLAKNVTLLFLLLFASMPAMLIAHLYDLCIVIWISVFQNPSDREIKYSDKLGPAMPLTGRREPLPAGIATHPDHLASNLAIFRRHEILSFKIQVGWKFLLC